MFLFALINSFTRTDPYLHLFNFPTSLLRIQLSSCIRKQSFIYWQIITWNTINTGWATPNLEIFPRFSFELVFFLSPWQRPMIGGYSRLEMEKIKFRRDSFSMLVYKSNKKIITVGIGFYYTGWTNVGDLSVAASISCIQFSRYLVNYRKIKELVKTQETLWH